MIGAAIMLIYEKPEEIFVHVEWDTIIFFIGLFLLIGGVEASGAISLVADWLLRATQGSQAITSMVILWGSAGIAGIIGNIPYTTAMTPVVASMQAHMTNGVEWIHPVWWSLSLGACLGGNLTIIGAAANVIVSGAAGKSGHQITFKDFFKYGASSTIIAMVMSSIYIWLRYLI